MAPPAPSLQGHHFPTTVQSEEAHQSKVQSKDFQMKFHHALLQMLIDLSNSSLKLIFDLDSGLEALESEFDKLFTGTFSLPVNLPGTNYNKAIKAKKKIVGMLERLIQERRALNKSTRNDMLDALLFNDDGTNSDLNNEQLIDLLISIVYTGSETVSATAMMAIKYLHDNPNALKELLNELLEIKQRKQLNDPVDWDDYKSMSFTRAVILETARSATIVNGVLRKTTDDTDFKGITRVKIEIWRNQSAKNIY